ncbi:MAG: hypothetical protein ACI9UN_003123 [Granulosicoccus sp.]
MLRIGTCVGFRIVDTDITPSLDGETAQVSISLLLGEEGEDDEPEELVEWAAFGFIFVLASLSFNDARPRGNSDIDYSEGDAFTIADLIGGLCFTEGNVCFSADYLRGRLLKTDIRVSKNGEINLTTHSRGKQASFWLDRLQGKKPLQIVG